MTFSKTELVAHLFAVSIVFVPLTMDIFVIPDSAAAQSPVSAEVEQRIPEQTIAGLQQTVASLEEDLRRQTLIADNAAAQLDGLRADLAHKDELIELAVQRNRELYEIASEVVEKGLSKRSLEPFVQAQRIRMENLIQDYEDQLRTARFYESTLPPSVQKRMEEDLEQSREKQEER